MERNKGPPLFIFHLKTFVDNAVQKRGNTILIVSIW